MCVQFWNVKAAKAQPEFHIVWKQQKLFTTAWDSKQESSYLELVQQINKSNKWAKLNSRLEDYKKQALSLWLMNLAETKMWPWDSNQCYRIKKHEIPKECAFLNSTWESAKTVLQSSHENEIKCSVCDRFCLILETAFQPWVQSLIHTN